MIRARRAAATALALVAMAGTAACSADDPGTAPRQSPGPSPSTSAATDGPYQPTEADKAAIRSLLDDRARALEEGDEQAFLTTVDATDDDLVAEQRTLFTNLAQLPVASVAYALDAGSGLPPAEVAGDDPTFRPAVTERVRLDGIDRAPVGNVLEDTFVRRSGGWVLGAETRAGDFPEGEEPQSWPWGGGAPVVAARQDDLVVLVDRDDSGSAPGLAAAMVDDIRADARVLGLEPRYDVLVDATTSGSVSRMNTLDQAQAAAVTFPVFALDRDGDAVRLAGLRIKVNPEQVDAYSADAFVLRHELTHFLTFRRLGGWPDWLSEGLADYVATQPLPFDQGPRSDAVSVLDGKPRALPTTARWGLDPVADYLVARAAVTYLADTYGMSKVLALGAAYRDADDGGDADQVTDRTLRRTLGITEDQLVDRTWALLDTLR